MEATKPQRAICLHPSEHSAFDPASRRVYCTHCYGARTGPIPVGPLNMRQMDEAALTPVLALLFDDLSEDRACVIFDRLMEQISQDGA